MPDEQGGMVLSLKEIYDMLIDTKEDLQSLRSELKETRTIIRDYNGLRKEVESNRIEVQNCRTEVQTLKVGIEAKAEGKKETGVGFNMNAQTVISALAFIVAVIAVIRS